MIDVHCHLEQLEFQKDLESVIAHSKLSGIQALVTSCAHPKDLEKTLEIQEKYKGFVFASLGHHPEYIKEIPQKEIDSYLESIKKNKARFVAIGEVGLDYFWVKEPSWQKKQKEQFSELIRFSKELKKPLVVHSRNSHSDTLNILEKEDAKNVLLHMFGGKNEMKTVVENNWLISINCLVTRSKDYKKIARDTPLENICLETDAPWNGIQKPLSEITKSDIIFRENKETGITTLRNDPTTIKITAQKIAEIKKIPFEKVWKTCGEKAKKFFNLQI